MKALLPLLIVAMAGLSPQAGTRPAETQPAALHFGYVDLFIDSGQQPLAAWELEFRTTAGQVKFVGVEGGDYAGFQSPPYYDPAALHDATVQQQQRIIVGAFSTASDLPAGKTRVARLHLCIEGDVRPAYAVKLIAAGAKDGSRITATPTFTEGTAP